jgi:hypothetical protein
MYGFDLTFIRLFLGERDRDTWRQNAGWLTLNELNKD